jgi:pilus assembly protein CpaB
MKLRIVLVLIAIVIAAGAVYGVMIYINSIKASYEEGVETVEVLVAAQNIPKEIAVEDLDPAGMIEVKGIPRIYLAEGVLTSLDEFEGYVVAAPINEGEQITTTKFIRPEEVGLAFIVPDGMIAVSIPVNEIIGVSNLIDVGDRVNVIATFFPEEGLSSDNLLPVEEEVVTAISGEEVSEGIKKDTTKTLLWNIEILYVGTRITTADETGETRGIFGGQQETDNGTIEIDTVTLAVTPEDSEKLVFSEEVGSVWLALVPTDGVEEKETDGTNLDNVFMD